MVTLNMGQSVSSTPSLAVTVAPKGFEFMDVMGMVSVDGVLAVVMLLPSQEFMNNGVIVNTWGVVGAAAKRFAVVPGLKWVLIVLIDSSKVLFEK